MPCFCVVFSFQVVRRRGRVIIRCLVHADPRSDAPLSSVGAQLIVDQLRQAADKLYARNEIKFRSIDQIVMGVERMRFIGCRVAATLAQPEGHRLVSAELEHLAAFFDALYAEFADVCDYVKTYSTQPYSLNVTLEDR